MSPLTLSLIAGAATLAAALTTALACAPRDALTTEVTINAPPAAVWAVLTDAAAYPDWNPFIRHIAGTFTAGARLTTRMHAGGTDRGMTFTPRVLVARPAVELRWRGRLVAPRLMDAEHSFVLHPTADGGTRVVHAETFRGIAMWVFRAETFRPDFAAMNAALKARVEG